MSYLAFSIHFISLVPYFIDGNNTSTGSESYAMISMSNELNALFNDRLHVNIPGQQKTNLNKWYIIYKATKSERIWKTTRPPHRNCSSSFWVSKAHNELLIMFTKYTLCHFYCTYICSAHICHRLSVSWHSVINAQITKLFTGFNPIFRITHSWAFFSYIVYVHFTDTNFTNRGDVCQFVFYWNSVIK